MGWVGVALLVVMLAVFVGGLWLGSLRPAPQEPEDPFAGIPVAGDSLTPRRVVVLREGGDGVFRAS